MLRQNKILGNMLGADIDFIVRGIDSKTRSVAVSCREAMRRSSLEDLGIKADIKSISENTDRDNLQKCRIQGKYAGRVTDVTRALSMCASPMASMRQPIPAMTTGCPAKRTMYLLLSPVWIWSGVWP